LDNSGKTSFIETIRRKFPITSSKPTIGLQREKLTATSCLGMEFIAWDLAGQHQYRRNYFQRERLVFLNATSLFYIIDIQDPERFTETINYLRHILNIFYKFHDEPRIIICLHKSDPMLQVNRQKYQELKKRIIPYLDLVLENFQYHIHFTSIFEISTLYRAISQGIIETHPKADIIQDFLKQYSRMTFSSAVILFSEDMLVIGEQSSHKRYLDICNAAASRFVIAMEKIEQYKIFSNRIIMEMKIDQNYSQFDKDSHQNAILFLSPIKLSNLDKFYLVTLTLNPNSIKMGLKYIPKLKNQLENFLSMVIQVK
jgi:GTPase SAR1 family protein